MDAERRFAAPVVGGSSLLVIFAVLCLTVFTLLGLSTVQADGRLSQRAARAVADYYRADCRAEEIYARLRAGERPTGVAENNGVYSYSCPISDTQRLRVQVRREGEHWTVLCWNAETAVEWQRDESLGVWDGT